MPTPDKGTRPQHQFLLYDGRARSGDTDDAIVLDTATSEKECRRVSRSHRGEDAIWYEYSVNGEILTEIGPRYDL